MNRITARFHQVVNDSYSILGEKYRECLKDKSVGACQEKYIYIVPEISIDTMRINDCVNKARVSKVNPMKEVDLCVKDFEKQSETIFESIIKDVEKKRRL